MNLLEIRTKFIELSGRRDLATIDYQDNGADFFLKAGQKTLDRFFGGDGTDTIQPARVFKAIVAGDIGVTFENCRAIKEVWIADTTARMELIKKDLAWLHSEVLTEPISNLDQETPSYWSPAMIRITPDPSELSASDLTAIGTFMDYVAVNQHRYNGIVFGPPADGDYTIEIRGLFYSFWPSADTGENFWTYQHPELLIQAGIYKLETFMRNSEGMKDLYAALKLEVEGIDMDIVEQQMAGITQMGDYQDAGDKGW